MRFRGRSYIAFVLTPEMPIFEWPADLDAWIRRPAGFFVGIQAWLQGDVMLIAPLN